MPTSPASAPGYLELDPMLRSKPPAIPWSDYLQATVIPYFVSVWLKHYETSRSGGEVVEVALGQFSYIFEIGPDRLIAAWGISQGRFAGARPKSRIAGHPVAQRGVYDAGHAISHRLGGGTDINLAAQLAVVNQGPFQQLEQRAVKTPGALYFTYWMYGRSEEKKIQLASRIQQGLLAPGSALDLRIFDN